MKIVTVLIGLFISIQSLDAQIDEAKVEAFVKRYAQQQEVPVEEVRNFMDQAEFDQSIIDKMNKPAEGMAWHRYRNIFMSEERMKAGIDFWNEHESTLRDVSAKTGVSEEAILGILGVETYFGQRKGSYRVLDALYTLAFGFPRRATFFTRELEEFLILAKEENLDVLTVKGSYAGAMGYSQFMPSSYRAYAKSYDAGGTCDLMESPEDAIASIANYLKVHRWRKGEMVASSVMVSPEATAAAGKRSKPKYDVAHFEALGYVATEDLSPQTPVALLEFEQKEGKEYWFGMNNFYVITRYNHSSMYALVVFQLGEAIREMKSL